MAQTDSPVQATSRPFGLDIVDTVKLAGSDSASANFQSNILPSVHSFVNTNLTERVAIGDSTTMMLDPSQLNLAYATDVRAYFIGEGAGYHNTLGFNTLGGGVSSGNPQLIFPDASSSNSYLSDPDSTGTRTSSQPLLAGDFVDLGSFAAGIQLDFFLIANGVNGGSNVYSTDESINPDGINHVVAHTITAAFGDNSPYLLLGFEDLYNGGDNDFNDLVFVVDIGQENVQYITETATLPQAVVGAPEPSVIVIFIVVLVIATIQYYFGIRKAHK